jgi:ABC-type lipoprotein release transport system permease subunit
MDELGRSAAPCQQLTFVIATLGAAMMVALVASWLSARRAARVDPASTLRTD